MANNYQAIYYRRTDGTQPVEVYIDEEVPAKQQPAILRQVDRLNTLNDAMPYLPFPHSSQIDGELRELRCHYGNTLYRILYRRSERLIVLLHMLLKTTGEVPQAHIEAATSAWKDYKARMDASPRVPRGGTRRPIAQTLAAHIARVLTCGEQHERTLVERGAVSNVSAAGTTVSAHLQRKLQNPEFRAEYERLASFEQLARIVITRRAAMGWTQKKLAEKMETTASAVSRLESGQHRMSPETLRKLAKAFNARAVMGLDFGTEAQPEQELVAL